MLPMAEIENFLTFAKEVSQCECEVMCHCHEGQLRKAAWRAEGQVGGKGDVTLPQPIPSPPFPSPTFRTTGLLHNLSLSWIPLLYICTKNWLNKIIHVHYLVVYKCVRRFDAPAAAGL